MTTYYFRLSIFRIRICIWICWIFIFGHVSTQQNRTCQPNPCMNGGRCLPIENFESEKFYGKCEPGFSLFENSCYAIVRSPMFFREASEYCRRMDARLASVASDGQKRLVAELATRSRSENGETGGDLWLDGGDESSLLQSKIPGKRSARNGRLASDGSALCKAATARSDYAIFANRTCRTRNIFACQKAELISKKAFFNFQCRCQPRYTGRLCEFSDDANQALQRVMCDGQTLDFACPNSMTIAVEYASFGRPSNETAQACRNGEISIEEKPCNIESTFGEIYGKCHGLPQCTLTELNGNFRENPCDDSFGYMALEFRFRCKENEGGVESLETTTLTTNALPMENPDFPNSISANETQKTTSATCRNETDLFYNGNCYRTFYVDDRSRRKSWSEARRSCISKGGDLISPVDSALYSVLSERLKILDERRVKYFWIGARADADANAAIRWITGQRVDFQPPHSKFDDGECVVFYVQTGKTKSSDRLVWLTKTCTSYYNWICQFPFASEGPAQQTSPEPTVATTELTYLPTTVPVKTPPVTKAPNHSPRTRATTTRRPRTTSTTTAVTTTMVSTDTYAETTTFSTTIPTTLITSTAVTPQETTTAFEATTYGFETSTKVFREIQRTTVEVDPSPVTLWIPENKRLITPAGPFRIRVPTKAPFLLLTSFNSSIEATSFDFSTTPVPPSAFLGSTTTLQPTSTSAGTTFEFTTASKDGDENKHQENIGTTIASESMENVDRFSTILGAGLCDGLKARDVSWPATREGAISCPTGTQGFAHWECKRVSGGIRFYPDNPNLSQCRHTWWREIENQLAKAQHPFGIVEEIRRYTISSRVLYGGDLENCLRLMEKLIILQPDQLRLQRRQSTVNQIYSEALKFSQLIGAIVDFIVSPLNFRAWHDFLLHDRMVQLSTVMRLVEENASFLSRFMVKDDTARLNYTNYAMKVEVKATTHAYTTATVPAQSHWPAPIDNESPIQPAIFAGSAFPGSGLTVDTISDAVTQPPLSFDFSMQADMASIVLPSRGVIAAAEQEKRVYNSDHMAMPHSRSSLDDHILPVSHQTDDDPQLRLGYFVYTKTLNVLLQPAPIFVNADETKNWITVVNSQIIGAVVNDPQNRLALPDGQNVTMAFEHLRAGENPRCVFWNTNTHSWDTAGCTFVNGSAERTICTCNHLTSFAVLMDVENTVESQLPEIHKAVLKYITLAGCALSAICLVASVLVFTCFRSIWNVRNSIHRNLCLALLVGELLFLFGMDETRNKAICTAVAVSLHYFFLVAFFWMLIEGYQLYTMLVSVFEPEKSRLVAYYMVSYGVPAVIVAVSVGISRQHYGTSAYCWINASSPVVWAFVAPVAVIILTNMIFLAVALKVSCGVGGAANNRGKTDKIKGWLKGSTMLLCLLGLTWVFGFFFVIRPATVYFAYVFTILNSLQGLFIFTFHVALNEKIQGVLIKWLKKHRLSFLPNYYSVNAATPSGTSSNESRNWLNHLTASTTATSYSFPTGGTITAAHREMMENMSNGVSSATRQRQNGNFPSMRTFEPNVSESNRHDSTDNGHSGSSSGSGSGRRNIFILNEDYNAEGPGPANGHIDYGPYQRNPMQMKQTVGAACVNDALPYDGPTLFRHITLISTGDQLPNTAKSYKVQQENETHKTPKYNSHKFVGHF